MKKLIFLIALFYSLTGDAQGLYIPINPDSILVPVNLGGTIRKVYVIDLIKNDVTRVKYTADSAAMKAVIALKLNSSDSTIANRVTTNTANIALRAPLASPGFTGTATTAITPATLDSSTKIPNTIYVDRGLYLKSNKTDTFIIYKDSTIGGLGTLISPLTIAGGLGWSLRGNTATDTSVNFLGTTDAHPLMFKVNNYRSGIIDYTGNQNTSLGYQTLKANTSGASNTSVGYQSLIINTTGARNTALGNATLQSVISGTDNTAIGNTALQNNTNNYNTGVGGFSLITNTSGAENSGLGYSSLFSNISGSYNVALGSFAMNGNTTGNYNIGIGRYALYNSITGGQNVAVGSLSLFNNKGSNNVALGYNTMLPYNASNSGNIGNTIFWTGNNGGDSTASTASKVGIDVTTPSSTLTILGVSSEPSGTAATGGVFGWRDGTGTQTVITSSSNSPYVTSIQHKHSSADNTYYALALNPLGGSIGVGTSAPNSTLHVNGSFATAVTSRATSSNLFIEDGTLKITATGQTFTLPTAVGITGRIYTIKLTASGSSTIATTSSQTIDASTTYSLSAQYKYVSVQSDGANWMIIANN